MNPNAQKAWDAIEQWKQDDCRYKASGSEPPNQPKLDYRAEDTHTKPQPTTAPTGKDLDQTVFSVDEKTFKAFEEAIDAAPAVSEAKAPVLPARNISRQESSLPTSSVQVLRCYERPTWKSLPPYEASDNAPDDRISREEIKQEIRELDSLRMEAASKELADIVYHRINELLDLLDNEE